MTALVFLAAVGFSLYNDASNPPALIYTNQTSAQQISSDAKRWTAEELPREGHGIWHWNIVQ
jgi:hypothetical protein